MLTKRPPVHRDRGDRRQRRGDRARHGGGIDGAHRVVKPAEALVKPECQQQSGRQLDAGLRDPQLVQQAGLIAIQRFGFGLRARHHRIVDHARGDRHPALRC
jgi:hypothetical protein